MKKYTNEQIQEVVMDMMKDMTKNTFEILLDNTENCISGTCGLEDKRIELYLNNTMIPINTAYQMSMYTITNVLCKLLCEDEGEEME